MNFVKWEVIINHYITSHEFASRKYTINSESRICFQQGGNHLFQVMNYCRKPHILIFVCHLEVFLQLQDFRMCDINTIIQYIVCSTLLDHPFSQQYAIPISIAVIYQSILVCSTLLDSQQHIIPKSMAVIYQNIRYFIPQTIVGGYIPPGQLMSQCKQIVIKLINTLRIA